MKKGLIILTSVILAIMISVCLEAKEITKDNASQIARSFFESETVTRGASTDLSNMEPLNIPEFEGRSLFYIFNNPAGKGFVIISGNTSAKKILAYSRQNSFNMENMPPQVKFILEQYAKNIASLGQELEEDISWSEKTIKTRSCQEIVHETALWDQTYPCDYYTPKIDGYNCPTGCVATSMAILMRHHQWPEQGKGSNSYEWKGQTLSQDFSSRTYNWDLMPLRNMWDDDFGEEQNEVALLMRDCGYSINMEYDLGNSAAATTVMIKSLQEYFDYAPGNGEMNRMDVDGDFFFNTIKKDIDNGFIVPTNSAHLPIGLGGHSFICDGYNEDGYIHLNYGWGGFCNGFYSIDMRDSFMGMDISIDYGIFPNKIPLTLDNLHFIAYSTQNLSYISNDDIKCWLHVLKGPLDKKFTLGIKVENQLTGETKIFERKSYEWNQDDYFFDTISFPENIEDGMYILYPIVRLEGCEWDTFHPNESISGYINLLVKDGKKYYINEETKLNADGNIIEKDGIYYSLDYDKKTATVEHRDASLNSYQGHIVIPEHITYENEEYTVTAIGHSAFESCYDLLSVTIPSTIEEIASGAFCNTGIYWINLEDANSLTELNGWAFSGPNLEYIIIPDNVTTITTYDFALNSLKYIEIPRAVNSIYQSFHNTLNLKSIKLDWETEKELQELEIYNPFENSSLEKIYIPEGTKSLYQKYSPWNEYELIEGEPDPVKLLVEISNNQSGQVIINPQEYAVNPIPMGTKLSISLQPDSGYELNQIFLNQELANNQIIDNNLIKYAVEDIIINVSFQSETEHLVSSIELNPKNGNFLLGDAPYQIETTIYPSNAKNKTLKWESLNPDIASVDDNGIVNLLSEGSTYILAFSTDGSDVVGICRINVFDGQEIKLELNVASINLNVGETYQLTCMIEPEEFQQEIVWKSLNEEIATVDKNGLVYGGVAGETIITASYREISAECSITVIGNAGVEGMMVDSNGDYIVYNLNGSFVLKTRDKNDIYKLNPGIYIINGKKVLIAK